MLEHIVFPILIGMLKLGTILGVIGFIMFLGTQYPNIFFTFMMCCICWIIGKVSGA